jgi:hypothetical protein
MIGLNFYTMKIYLKILLVLFLIVKTNQIAAQWGNQWVLGRYKGLDFNNIGMPQPWEPNGLYGAVGNSIICDDDGQTLLYSDGEFCYNKLHQQMPNGYNLGAQNSSQTQNSIIIPHPDGSNRFYIFAVDECYDLLDTAFCSSLGNYGGVIWAMVDMDLEGGLGDVVLKQQHLYYPTCSKITATRHCNGVDWWVITKEYNTNRFITYSVDANGINPLPVNSPIGLNHPFNYPIEHGISAKRGQMKVSSDGKLLGVKTLAPCITQLFHFNNQTGIVYNPVFTDYHDTLNPNASVNFDYGAGLSFSPDNTKLYVNYGSFALNLVQYDIGVLDSVSIMNSKINVLQNSPIGWRSAENIQFGPDSKMYFHLQDSSFHHNISWLNYPNLSTNACSPSNTYLHLTNDTINFEAFTPNIIDCIYARHHQGALLIPNCSGGLDSLSFTDTLMNVVHPFTWDFGDPTSGVNNTSNAHFPIHNFTAPGTYTVTLTVQNDCDGYTVAQQVTITNNVPVIPTVALVGIHLESSVGQNYQWYFNGNTIVGATNQTYSPLQSGYYSVLVTDSNGCLAQSQEFYFAVTNLNHKLVDNDIKVIPNPAQQSISIVSNKFISNISIVDMAGRMVIQSAENKNIDVSFLNSGIYFLQANSNNEIIRTKFVKN